MRFATLCSGIGAPEVAAHRLGMEPVFCSEIEPFPCAVLAHHWPDVPNYGDMTAWRDWPHHDLDLLIAGTPCQAFSVAGLRQGLDDARGNLTLEFARYVNSVRPRFVLWENVPGVLSDKSNAFGCLLGGLAGCDAQLLPRGGRWTNAGFVSGPKRQIAWRILDAQHFGVAQRRRRVWLLAGDPLRGAGDWACARALFPEPSGLRWDSPAGGEKGEETSGASGGGSHWDGGPHPALNQSNNVGGIGLSNQELFSQRGAGLVARTVTAHIGGQTGHDMRPDNLVTHTLRGEGFDASEDGTGRGTPLVAVYESHGQDSRVKDLGDTCSTVSAKYGTGGGNTPIVCFDTAQITSPGNYSVPKPGDPAPPLNTAAQHHVAFTQNQREEVRDLGGVAGAVSAAGGTHQDTYIAKMVHWQQGGGEVEDNVSGALRANAEHSYQFARIHSTVRRLTPRECERLQGFPDDHTAVQYRNKPACDGPRYKALGNSMAVPCVEWILGNLLLTASSSRRP
jgi:DNA (cytosine-5)-methyltransferase 1